ncbi:unnamed protein product [Clonostachys rosea]|uniref:non-specific serine/threonine protein kinase n=1 Tax=Bionectria ochroleuca TaxID=29856 RepID=A0ABY6V174_BIOOC|nr:unnamed protein product [Clonostachys rosea]
MEDVITDLARDWELKSEIRPGYTLHTKYISDPARGIRRRPIEEKWERDDTKALGHGTFGTVWLERCTSGPSTGQIRAVKQIYKRFGHTSVSTKALSGDLSAMMKFSHETYRHCFVQSLWYDSPDYLYITMEYLSHGDLSRHLQNPLPEAEASLITLQVLEGLEFMHRNKFAHRDLKPNNILVQHAGPNWWVKISDFGTSKQIETTALRTIVGTETYQAPEVRGIFTPADMAENSERLFSLAVDLWAVGAIAFRMATGGMLFSTPRELYSYVVLGTAFPFEKSLSADCNAFISSTMHASPKQRPHASEALAHSWFSLASAFSTYVDRQPVIPTETLSLRVRDSAVEGSAEWPTLSNGVVQNTDWSVKVLDVPGSSGPRIGTISDIPVYPWAVVRSEPSRGERTPMNENLQHQNQETGSTIPTTNVHQSSSESGHPHAVDLRAGDGQDGLMISAVYSPDGKTLAICMEYAIHTYAIGEGGIFKEMDILRNPDWQLIEGLARIVAFIRDRGGNRSLELWEKKGRHYGSNHKVHMSINDVELDAWALSQGSTTLVLGCHKTSLFRTKDETQIRVYGLSPQTEMKIFAPIKLKDRVKRIVASPDGQEFAQYIDATTCTIWRYLGKSSFVQSQTVSWAAINFSADGCLLAAKDRHEKFILLRKNRHGLYAEIQQLSDQESTVAAFSPDGTFLATPHGGIVIWEESLYGNMLDKKWTLSSQAGVSSISYSAAAQQLAMVSPNGVATIWHL